ncbi:hypothetical protein ACU4GA_02740 [Methylobacterium oryzae CBMB20]
MPRSTAELNNIPESWGTAVNVQAMVFGNMGRHARPPAWRSPATRSTGEKALYGEFLINAQGEDVVAGIRIAAEHRPRRRGKRPRATSLPWRRPCPRASRS